MTNRDFFETHGFVILKDALSETEADKLKYIGSELEKLPEQKGKWMIYFEKGTQNKARLENFINYNDDIKDFLYNVIMPKIQTIYDKDLVLFKDKMNWKRPNGKGFHAHQDQPAWLDFPAPIYHTLALFIDTSTKEKGCLEFVENFRKKEIISHELSGNGGLSEETEKDLEFSLKETTPRDILFFNSFVPHRSGPNNTNESRRILYFTFNDLEHGDFYDSYIKKKRELFPPDIEREENKEYSVLGNKYNLANPIR